MERRKRGGRVPTSQGGRHIEYGGQCEYDLSKNGIGKDPTRQSSSTSSYWGWEVTKGKYVRCVRMREE